MVVPWNSIKQNKPAIFDWLVFSISLLMGLVFPALRDLTTSPGFSGWMLAGLLLYTTGLWLKHRPLYYRLAKQGREQKNFFIILFLIVGHWVIMLAAVMLSEEAFRQITGLPPVPKYQTQSGLHILTGIFTAALITWFAFRPGRKSRKLLTEQYLFRRELAADIILICGVSMLSFVFWEESILSAMSHMQMDSFGDILMLFIFLGLAYMLFYLPLRYLYLIEDNNRQAWRRLLIIFVLILVRSLFETLRF